MFLSPREKLTLALEKTSKIATLYAKIHSDGTTKLTETKTGAKCPIPNMEFLS
jgi:hypothetical protein